MKTTMALFAAGILLLPSLAGAAQKLPAACGPEASTLQVKTKKSETPPLKPVESMARLVFVNDESHCLGCSTVNVGLDGKWVGGNKGNSYFAVTVAPGNRQVCSYLEGMGYEFRHRVELTELNVEAGKTYYFATDVIHNSNYNAGRLRLRALAADEGEFLVSQSKVANWGAKAN